MKALMTLMLSSGLRVSEAVSLKIEDVNFDDKLIKIKSNKANKDRLTIMQSRLIDDIKQYLLNKKENNPYLFPIRDTHVTIKLAQKIIKQAARKANLSKRIYCHALRSTFAKYLADNNIDNSTVKELLGNNSFNNIYSPAYVEKIKNIKNPFDSF